MSNDVSDTYNTMLTPNEITFVLMHYFPFKAKNRVFRCVPVYAPAQLFCLHALLVHCSIV